MPPDVNETYDPPVDDDRWAVPTVVLSEPPVGAVIAYRRAGRDGRTLDYVSLRAGDGRWYTTGAQAAQGVAWPELVAALRAEGVTTISVAVAWSPPQVIR